MRTEALKKAQARYYEKLKNNEEYIEKRKEKMKNYYNIKKQDPEFKKDMNQRSIDYYYKNRETILAKKKEYYIKKKNNINITETE